MTGEQAEWLARVGPRYDEPHRCYHTRRHLCTVLVLLQHWSRARGFTAIPPTLFFAALYHDAVYDPKRSDNEEASARICSIELRAACYSHAFVDEVQELIASTRHHQPTSGRFAARALINADLWILGAPWNDYCEYAAQIRQEYRHVPDDAFHQGRASVLTGFLARPRIYRGESAAIHNREAHARFNLREELAFLTS